MKNAAKPIVDILMAALFLAQMAYHLEGNTLHEWLGTALAALFLLHQLLNRGWYKSLFRGKHPPARILMAAVNLLLLIMMLGSAASGVMLSRRVAHLGLHWGMFLQNRKLPARHCRIVTAAASLYGAYARFARQLPGRMLLRIEFTFFDYEEPALLFFGDYLAVLVLFAAAGHYLTRLLQGRLLRSIGNERSGDTV